MTREEMIRTMYEAGGYSMNTEEAIALAEKYYGEGVDALIEKMNEESKEENPTDTRD